MIRCESCCHLFKRENGFWFCRKLRHVLESGQAMLYHSERCKVKNYD
jgi:hypothetical protein